jgi:serine/threonine protein kinase
MKICEVCGRKYDAKIECCPEDEEPLELESKALFGKILDGQYLIETLIGRGGMGKVYRARHTLLNDRVAIKVILPGLIDAQFKQRFLREGQAARHIKHPNIVSVYDLRAIDDGLIYMVMEYVEGHTLKKVLDEKKRFSPSEALELLGPIGGALNEAHSKGIVHRDLKPENILISNKSVGSATVKLLDLGLAKMRPVSNKTGIMPIAITSVGQMLGTPLYMPPEQWGSTNDEHKDIDGRADIYSLGIILYEMIAGVRPFTGPRIENLFVQHMSITPKPLDEVAATVPRDFSLAISQAMSKDPAQRQKTVAELFEQLQNSLSTSDNQSTNIHLKPTIIDTKERIIIKHISGSKAGQSEDFFTRDHKEITFGRDPSSTVKFDPFRDDLVARKQAVIGRDESNDARFTITDLNSQNGTFVNKERVSGSLEIIPEDKIQFGIGGPIFELDIDPKPLPKTRTSNLIPETRTADIQFPPTRLDDSANRQYRQNLIIKHLNGSKAGMVEQFSINNFSQIDIGRDPGSAIKYDTQKDDLVSFRHAKIMPKATGVYQFVIIDLNSRNGTFINNQRVSNSVDLKPGDIIQLGQNGPSFEFNIK